MSRSLNKVTLIGNLGGDPEVRATPNGGRVAQFSLATSRTWSDQAGVRQEKTEWHRCVVWNTRTSSLADIVEKYCHKGEKVYIEGRIEYRSWTDQDGQTRYATEINVRELILLGGQHTGTGGRASDEGDDEGDAGTDGDEPDFGAQEAPSAREQQVSAEAPARSASRRTTTAAATGRERTAPSTATRESVGAPVSASEGAPAEAGESDDPGCPKCGGRMWDNRTTKRNPKAPDYKCRDRSCDGVIWPSREGGSGSRAAKAGSARATAGAGARAGSSGRARDEEFDDFPGALSDPDDDLPF